MTGHLYDHVAGCIRQCAARGEPPREAMAGNVDFLKRAAADQAARIKNLEAALQSAVSDLQGVLTAARIPQKQADKVLAPYRAVLAGVDAEEDCPVCGGDCSAANPPVTNCPLFTKGQGRNG